MHKWQVTDGQTNLCNKYTFAYKKLLIINYS